MNALQKVHAAFGLTRKRIVSFRQELFNALKFWQTLVEWTLTKLQTAKIWPNFLDACLSLARPYSLNKILLRNGRLREEAVSRKTFGVRPAICWKDSWDRVSSHQDKEFQLRQLIFSEKSIKGKVNICFNERRLATSSLFTNLFGTDYGITERKQKFDVKNLILNRNFWSVH